MGIDDFASPQAAVMAGVTAALMSERTRGVLRRGAVYGVAGALKAGDVVAGAARGAARGARGDGAATNGAGPPAQRARRRTPARASEAKP